MKVFSCVLLLALALEAPSYVRSSMIRGYRKPKSSASFLSKIVDDKKEKRRALKGKKEDSSDEDTTVVVEISQRSDEDLVPCTNAESVTPIADQCKTSNECLPNYKTCRQLSEYKRCSDGSNYLEYPRVCYEGEVPGSGNIFNIPTLSPTTQDERDDSGSAVVDIGNRINDGTEAGTGPSCVPPGVSNYVKNTVLNWVPDAINEPDECISNDEETSPCPGSCKAYMWNVCDPDNELVNAEAVKPICVVTSEEESTMDAPTADTRTDGTDNTQVDIGNRINGDTPSIKCAPAGVSNYVKYTVTNWVPNAINEPDECISNDEETSPCPGSCKGFLWNVCDPDNLYVNSKAILPLCLAEEQPSEPTDTPKSEEDSEPTDTPKSEEDRVDVGGDDAPIDVPASATTAQTPLSGLDPSNRNSNLDCVPPGPSVYVKSYIGSYDPDAINAPDECISNVDGPCPGKCKAYFWNVCDSDNKFKNAAGVKLLCM